MTAIALAALRLRKELRGLLPIWGISLASIAASAALGYAQLFGIAAYWTGAIALGALSMGQEYNARTLSFLLAQPIRRGRLYAEKLGVLAALLTLLSAATIVLVAVSRPLMGHFHWVPDWWSPAVSLPLLCAFFLAPCLTMVCRSALAGMVFAAAIPAALWLAGEFAVVFIYGGDLSQTEAARALRYDIFVRGTLIVSVLGGVAGSWLFLHLEALGSRNLAVAVPSWLRRTGSVADAASRVSLTRQPAWLVLLRKELHLQQVTFALSAIYVAGWIAVFLIMPAASPSRTTSLFVLTLFHTGAVPLLAGSLASAEERQLGTLEWQALLPMAAFKQWLSKSSVAIGMALLLTMMVPRLLLAFTGSDLLYSELGGMLSTPLALAIVTVVVVGLYVSSLCASGLRALLISLPATLLILDFARVSYLRWYVSTARSVSYAVDQIRYDGWTSVTVYGASFRALQIAGYVGGVALLASLALRNHRSNERGAARIWRQLARVAVFAVVFFGLSNGVFRLYASAIDERDRIEQIERGVVSGSVIDDQGNAVTDCTIVVFFPRDREPPFFFNPNSRGQFQLPWLLRPGQYRVAAQRLDRTAKSEVETLERLKALATPIVVEAGRPQTIRLGLLH